MRNFAARSPMCSLMLAVPLLSLALAGQAQEHTAQQEILGFNHLVQAVFGNRLDELKRLGEQNPKLLDLKNEAGFSLAHFAAGINSPEILRYLSDVAPGTLTSRASDGSTPAYIAAQEGAVECLGFLAEQAVDSLAVARSDRALPAHAAASDDNHECLALLAEHVPTTLGSQDAQGNTPAHIACTIDAVDSLLVLKANVADSRLNIKNQNGKTPLDVSRDRHHAACEAVLLGRSLSTEQRGVPETGDWLPVVAEPEAVRLFRRWTSMRRPEHRVTRETPSHWSSNVSQKQCWDFRPEASPDRVLFFTSAEKPLEELSQLNPNGKDGQFAFWDGALIDHAFHFLAKAGLVAPEDRDEYGIWILGDGRFSDLFKKNSEMKLFMTYSTYADRIREAGGVPVKLITSDQR